MPIGKFRILQIGVLRWLLLSSFVFIIWSYYFNSQAISANSLKKFQFQTDSSVYINKQMEIINLCDSISKETNIENVNLLYNTLYDIFPDHPFEFYLLIRGSDEMNKYTKDNYTKLNNSKINVTINDKNFQNILNLKLRPLPEYCENTVYKTVNYISVNKMFKRILLRLKADNLWNLSQKELFSGLLNKQFVYDYSYYFDNKISLLNKKVIETQFRTRYNMYYNNTVDSRRLEFLAEISKLDEDHILILLWFVICGIYGESPIDGEPMKIMGNTGVSLWDRAVSKSEAISAALLACSYVDCDYSSEYFRQFGIKK